MPPAISVKNLIKTFQFPLKNPSYGLFRNFFNPDKKIVTAVDDVSFKVGAGETVAFIGQNGAGKSTCIKMLTGILYPTSGEVRVLGLNPQENRRQLAYKIGTVFGQRSQLIFNLPVRDSLQLFGRMYSLTSNVLKKRTAELIELFEMGEFVDQPVRKLSLGQRMRAEIAVSLIHNPQIIFLDEPTIGLDILAKRKLREILGNLNKESNTTIFLTSHDAGDIEVLCKRTIIINHGQVIFDDTTEKLQRNFLTHKDVRLELKKTVKKLQLSGIDSISGDGTSFRFSIDTTKHSLNDVLREVLQRYEVVDMEVENPSLEEVIGSVYQEKKKI